MDPAERTCFEQLMVTRKRQLSRQVGDRLHQNGLEHHDQASLPRRSDDTDDEASASSLRDADVVSLARAARDLALIDAACERLAKGSYGVCVDCDDPIAPQRLLASPEAARCASCQERFERERRRGG